ncbi:la-related protein [Salix suchowensis]|nr:la-related protein [Salix suchowensis]
MLLGEETTREGEKKERDGLVSFTASSKRLLFSPSSSSSSSMDGEVPPPVPTEEPLLDFIPVGSPEADVHALPSDEDHDREHEQSSGPTVQTVDLKNKIIKQVEYYFSDENLPTDNHMIGLIKKNKEGFVPITAIASFRKMKKLTRDSTFIVAALRESSILVVNSDGKKVKRLYPFHFSEVEDPKLCTVLVENLPEDHSLNNLQRMFGAAGKIKNISIRDPLAVEKSKKGSKTDILISSKLHAFVEYDTVEAAEKAVATLNNEQDWRNGMRVKLLKQTAKHGQRRQVWREPDPEKNRKGRGTNLAGDVEKHHNSSENHDDTPVEEDGEHISKEKNGQQGGNRGRSRKNKFRAANGMGHGTTSFHAVEPTKPPPGPKMPDGTRGFTVGRGRPPNT